MRYNRAFPIFVPLATWLMLEYYFFNHQSIYVVSGLIVFLSVFTLWRFAKESVMERGWWNFSILPIFFSSAIIVYSVLLDNQTAIQLLFFIDLIFLYFYLRFSYYYLIKPSGYKVSSIENLSSYANFFSYFLISAALFGLQSYLSIWVWPLMVILVFTSILAIYQLFWANKIKIRESLLFIIIPSLILLELGWSISFLPLNFNIAGLILSICYYVTIGLTRLYLANDLEKDKVRLYLSLGISSILLILLTARWL